MISDTNCIAIPFIVREIFIHRMEQVGRRDRSSVRSDAIDRTGMAAVSGPRPKMCAGKESRRLPGRPFRRFVGTALASIRLLSVFINTALRSVCHAVNRSAF
jgi:hypothetical protein